MDNQSIKVYIRARKPSGPVKPTLKFFPDEKTIGIPAYLIGRKRISASWKKQIPEDHCIRTNGILYHASQDETYRITCNYAIEKALHGFSALIMSFGPRNTGKTTTMFGVTQRHEFQFRGCAVRALETMMDFKETKANWEVKIDLSFAMFQRDRFLDLLKPNQQMNDIVITEENGWMNLKGLSKTPIKSFRDGAECILIGNQQRHVIQDTSTPSHAILTFYISVRKFDETGSGITSSKVHFIDFCAPVHDTHSQITLANNMDMMVLGQVMECHRLGVLENHMFRRSKILQFLKDIFRFNGYLRFIAHVLNDLECLKIGTSSLLLAAKLLKTKFRPIQNISIPESEKIHQLEKKVSNLRKELYLQDALLEKPHRHELEISNEYKDELKRQVMSYIQGTHENIDVASLSQVKLVYSLFKDYVKEALENEVKIRDIKRTPSYSKAASSRPEKDHDLTSQDGVGQLLTHDIAIGPAGKGVHRGTGSTGRRKDRDKPQKDAKKQEKTDAKINLDSSVSLEKDLESSPSKRNSFLNILYNLDKKDTFDAEKQNLNDSLDKFRFDKGKRLMDEVRQIADELNYKQKMLMSLIQKQNECRNEMENLKISLAGEQNERHVSGDSYDEDGNIVTSSKEKDMVIRMKDLENIHESLRSKIIETKTAIAMKQELGVNLRKRFEKEFFQYCIEFDKPMDFIKNYQDKKGLPVVVESETIEDSEHGDKAVYNEIIERLSKVF